MPNSYPEAGHLTHAYAITGHKAQGMTTTVHRALVQSRAKAEEAVRRGLLNDLQRSHKESRAPPRRFVFANLNISPILPMLGVVSVLRVCSRHNGGE